MAFTLTVNEKTVFGNQVVYLGTVLADSTAGSVATGLGVITHNSVTPKSVTSGYKVASTGGTLAITGCTSGDEFFVAVYGR